MDLTEAQKDSIETLKKRWTHVSNPCPLGGSDRCAMVVVTGETGMKMVLGIEEDGYTHS